MSHTIGPDDYDDILSDQEIDDIRWITRRCEDYGREAGRLDENDIARIDRIRIKLSKLERDRYVEEPPANAEQLRERNAKVIAHTRRTHCVNCGQTEREHLGPNKLCRLGYGAAVAHPSDLIPIWTPGVAT